MRLAIQITCTQFPATAIFIEHCFEPSDPLASPPRRRCRVLRLVARRKAGETRLGQLADHAFTQEGILHMDTFMQKRIEKTDAMLAVQLTVDAHEASLISP
jgi:hypothetical protein